MEGKLVKTTSTYHLVVNDKIIASKGDSDGKLQKLSLKNCEVIANGYDLDELVKERFGETFWHDGDKYFKEGFQKALEILGDKKFSADEIIKAYNDGWSLNYDYFQSLQQTEWDVEIEMERSKFITDKSLRNNIKNGFNYTPKLDADGCLILKRK